MVVIKLEEDLNGLHQGAQRVVGVAAAESREVIEARQKVVISDRVETGVPTTTSISPVSNDSETD